MPISANASGVVTGKFTIPSGIKSGSKEVELVGAAGSRALATFVGRGALVNEVMQATIRTTKTFRDPLAQTFALTEDAQIGAAEVYVTAKGATPITLQIRETQVGFPTQVILAEATKQPSAITVNAWNRFEFARPVRALANAEYAIVVLCNDANGAIAIAELGKWDGANNRWVTQQPYQVGTLLSSSNASTWTAHQDRDMAFRLLARRYTETSREVNLGTVAVTGATDLIVLPMTDNPATGADSELELTMPDSSVIRASDGQTVSLPSAVTGNIAVKAKLRATEKASAVLHPGTQIVAGNIETSAEYITRAIEADAAGANVRVIFDAEIPSGATVTVFVKGVDAGDTWASVSQEGSAKPLGDGVYEYQYVKTGVTEARVQVKLVLTGTAASRPYVYNLRVSVT